MQGEKSTPVNFQERLKSLMRDSGLTQKELAHAIGVSETSLINYKRGRIPIAEELLKLSKYFEVTMEWFLTGEDDSPKSESAWKTRCQVAETKLGIAKEALQAVLKKLD